MGFSTPPLSLVSQNLFCASLGVGTHPQHPTALELLREGLEAERPETIYLAEYLIKDREHPLLSPALRAAARLLPLAGRHVRPDFSACRLIARYGDDNDFALLLQELREAQEGDPDRYTTLWQSSYGAPRERSLQLCGLVIGDRRAIAGTSRFCDSAAARLQETAGVDFGFDFEKPVAERDEAIAKAKAWLAQHARSALP